MGLDLVELVMAVEEEFEVNVTDDVFAWSTVGELHVHLCQILNSTTTPVACPCPSHPPFFATRNSLMQLVGLDRRKIRPSASLEQLIEVADRRKVWIQLQRQTGISLPSLEHPDQAKTWFLCTAIGILLLFEVTLLKFHGAGEAPFLLVTGLCWLAAATLARKHATEFPAKCQTVRDIVERAKPPQFPSQRSRFAGDSKLVWSVLVQVVSEQLDYPVSDISPDSRFIEDLNCD